MDYLRFLLRGATVKPNVRDRLTVMVRDNCERDAVFSPIPVVLPINYGFDVADTVHPHD